MSKRNGHTARAQRQLSAETLPAPRRVAVSPFVPWVSWRSFGFLQCVMLLQLIFAWDPFVVGAMDTCEIADAAVAAASTAGTLVVCALAGTVASLCATADEEDASGNAGAQQWIASTSGVQNATVTDTGTAAETASAGTSPACTSPVMAGACTGTHIADSGGDVRSQRQSVGKRSRKEEVPKDVMHRLIKEWGLQKPQHSKNPVWKWARKYKNPPSKTANCWENHALCTLCMKEHNICLVHSCHIQV